MQKAKCSKETLHLSAFSCQRPLNPSYFKVKTLPKTKHNKQHKRTTQNQTKQKTKNKKQTQTQTQKNKNKKQAWNKTIQKQTNKKYQTIHYKANIKAGLNKKHKTKNIKNQNRNETKRHRVSENLSIFTIKIEWLKSLCSEGVGRSSTKLFYVTLFWKLNCEHYPTPEIWRSQLVSEVGTIFHSGTTFSVMEICKVPLTRSNVRLRWEKPLVPTFLGNSPERFLIGHQLWHPIGGKWVNETRHKYWDC